MWAASTVYLRTFAIFFDFMTTIFWFLKKIYIEDCYCNYKILYLELQNIRDSYYNILNSIATEIQTIFYSFSRSVPFTFASSPLFESLEQATTQATIRLINKNKMNPKKYTALSETVITTAFSFLH